jgi:Putative peptidoglycan binding domain
MLTQLLEEKESMLAIAHRLIHKIPTMTMKLLSIACAALVATTGFSHAGGAVGVRAGGVAVGVKWGGGRYWGPRYVYGPRYYRPWYGPRYYRPWYGPRVVVAAPPVVVAPRVVAPAVAYSGVAYPGSLVVASQARLQKLGYYRGAVDGAFGPLTAEAIRGFQSDNGLPVTGDLDVQTQRRLGL